MAQCHIIPYFKGRRLSLGAILPIHIEQFYHALLTEKGLSPNSVIHIHELIFGVFKYAKKNHMITENPVEYVDRPKKQKYVANHYNLEELNELLRVAKGTEIEVPVYLAAYFGLRRSEALGVRWSAIDFDKKTLSIQHSVVRTKDKETGILGAHGRDQLKTESSFRTLPLSDEMASYLKDLKIRQTKQQLLCGKNYCRDYPDYLCINKMGNIIQPDYVTARFNKLLKQNGLRHIRFHDLRHPYVKHTTKIFSLRLMDFQAQAYPDARRKTRGACQLHRGGQSQSPVRPLCNRKRFSCLPPQSKISRILYAISLRLSGYTSTLSISSSASAVVSVSASKIALDASLRLSCRACSSCFCFACANTAA